MTREVGFDGDGPPFELFRSKLAVPPLRRGVLQRRSQVRHLAGDRETRYVSVVAPAGYGKTTLLAQWADEDERPFAWVSLDHRDNDPVVLLTYVAAALDGIEPIDPAVYRLIAGGGDALWSRGLPRLGAALTGMRPLVLVLDDVHELHDPRSLDGITALALEVPRGSQLVLSGRAEAALPLATRRAERDLIELGPAELALTNAQAAALLAGVGVRLSDPEIAELNARTEGWAAGLYLAALSIQASVDGKPSGFSGDDPFVIDYLRAESLAQIEPRELEFLTRTSILDRMSASLCDEVLGRKDSARVLATLEHANLFVVPLDRHRHWYRYHRLFRDMLRSELADREPDRVAELNRSAAAWCERHDEAELALEYGSAAGDLDEVARLLLGLVFPLYRSGRAATLDRWFAEFDDPELLDRFPAVAVFGSFLHVLNGRAEDAERWAYVVESSRYEGPMPDGSTSLRPWVAVLEALMCRRGIDEMGAEAERAVAELPAHSPWRPIALLLRGIATLLAGEPERAEAMLHESADAAVIGGARYAGVVAHSELALLAVSRGELDGAEAELEQARAFADAGAPGDYVVTAIMYAARAKLALARGRGTLAREELVRAQLVRPRLTHALSWFSVQSLLELARVSLALGDGDGARTLVLEIDDVLHRRPRLGTLVAEAEQLRAELAAFTEKASGWAFTLTAAELRLLPLLTTHLSFREIAERLHVSRNTVKTQAISVYRKLDATSRSEAIARAVELGLVDEAVAARPVEFTPSG